MKVKGYTIDSKSAVDLDDGFSVRKLRSGFSLCIAIANPGEFVKYGDRAWILALKKMQSRYLPGKVIHMLPRGVYMEASLLPGKARPALLCHFHFDAIGNCLEFEAELGEFENVKRWCHRSVEKSLEQVDDSQLVNALELAKLLRMRRTARGSVYTTEADKLTFVNEDGYPVSSPSEYMNAESIISEFMIITNEIIATWAHENQVPFIYRNHDFNGFAPTLGMDPLDIPKAKYETVATQHGGLRLKHYSHCTSPLRRLPDFLNLMNIRAYLHGETFADGELVALAHLITEDFQENADKKKVYLKLKANQLIKKTSEADAQTLVAMENKKFSRIVKLACRGEYSHSDLLTVLHKRRAKNGLNVGMYHDLYNSKLEELVSFAHESFKLYPEVATQIIAYPGYEFIQIEAVEASQGLFHAEAKALLSDALLMTQEVYEATSKKEAKHLAAVGMLIGLWEKSLVPFSEGRLIPMQVQPKKAKGSRPSKEIKDPVSRLHVYHQKNRIAPPKFVFEQISGGFMCKAISEDNVAQGIGASKKAAKIQASLGLLKGMRA